MNLAVKDPLSEPEFVPLLFPPSFSHVFGGIWDIFFAFVVVLGQSDGWLLS